MTAHTAARAAGHERATGRTARTKGVSMQPDELADVVAVEELTGVGFSEVYRRYFAPQMKAAADLLRETQAAGVEINRSRIRDVWYPQIGADEMRSVYAASSELMLGE